MIPQVMLKQTPQGLKMKADWEAKLANLEQTLLRILGAIQVMEEMLAEAE